MPLPPRERTDRRDLWVLGGLFVLMIAGLAGLAAATGWAETLEEIGKLTAWQVVGLLALSLVNYLFRGMRWHLFAMRLGLPTGFIQDLRHFIGGFAMSATPGRVGELVRMRWIRRETGWSFERTAPLVLVDRASDLVAMALILALALALSAGEIAGAMPIVILALGTAWIATHPSLLAAFALRSYRMTGRLPRIWARVRAASRSLAAFRGPWTIGFAAVLGTIGWMAEGYAFHLLLVWMGSDIGLWTAVAIFIFSALAGGLTGAPGGVGGAEAAMIALLTLEGVPLSVSVPATLIIRVTTLWFAILLGLLVFPLAERQSMRGAHGAA
ncbi:lysylphosphatidylglycerol synthase transmembrane domain-containing protein [Ovoidimarina sediminis]|uniref:lysylphosphatidylglycerol synthase transmembrane domain-containing protein n=1 Tax=Ovoidimarina sediminis TaxID=3079856 RepID=UPI00290CB480|nr:lysylphosphatidylglycerol synthase transmembrane domain-containing protein [Rhodophyticola sp. MJ-SS7]MDU8942943.1 lysylphosphatidylglycerol synthase transmembrane domain-containing protein [Rhodophyticola sp. MJ-SS7]